MQKEIENTLNFLQKLIENNKMYKNEFTSYDKGLQRGLEIALEEIKSTFKIED